MCVCVYVGDACSKWPIYIYIYIYTCIYILICTNHVYIRKRTSIAYVSAFICICACARTQYGHTLAAVVQRLRVRVCASTHRYWLMHVYVSICARIRGTGTRSRRWCSAYACACIGACTYTRTCAHVHAVLAHARGGGATGGAGAPGARAGAAADDCCSIMAAAIHDCCYT